ncbi:MAG: serine/threonine-protein kinase, partial [Myxococcota bacterium]
MERGTLVGGKYRLTRPLAEGGMGSVWVAEHTELGVDIAVKFIAEDDPSPEAYARFRREAKVAAQLRSQHVVQVLDYGVVEARPYIAMELLQGEDLKRRLDRKGSLSLAETAQIVEQLSRAVDDAHASGLIHRDIKPRNVFLARYTRGEVVK